jgi:putative hydrolase of the HAD superfamily
VGDGGSYELTGADSAGVTAIRLRAPDLKRHLVYNADAGWTGPVVTSLSEVIAFAASHNEAVAA